MAVQQKLERVSGNLLSSKFLRGVFIKGLLQPFKVRLEYFNASTLQKTFACVKKIDRIFEFESGKNSNLGSVHVVSGEKKSETTNSDILNAINELKTCAPVSGDGKTNNYRNNNFSRFNPGSYRPYGRGQNRPLNSRYFDNNRNFDHR